MTVDASSKAPSGRVVELGKSRSWGRIRVCQNKVQVLIQKAQASYGNSLKHGQIGSEMVLLVSGQVVVVVVKLWVWTVGGA